ncbi:MAG: DNA-directed RNA polymerase subunit omega [Eubacterium sp.]|nr:DNA-directed RNA polymerase subunit omega [Eubacterium sp.]
MLYPSINEIREKVDSRYTLVVLAAKRARDIIDGYPLFSANCPNDRAVSQAAYEIHENAVGYNRD